MNVRRQRRTRKLAKSASSWKSRANSKSASSRGGIIKIGSASSRKSKVKVGSAFYRKKKAGAGLVRHRKRTAHPTRLRSIALWSGRAYRAGRIHAQGLSEQQLSRRRKEMRISWNSWLNLRKLTHIRWSLYEVLCRHYLRGYKEIRPTETEDWLLPTLQTTGAVITVRNEEKALPDVLKQLRRLQLDEVIIVVNGSNDGSFAAARKMKEAIVIHYPEPLGHDIGRAIGAMASTAEILLFLDGDLPISAEQLVPFIGEIARGKDIALNDLSTWVGLFSQRDTVTMMKEFLNRMVGKPSLGVNSLTAIPHAMSRRAMERIGYSLLAVPPKAQAKAIQLGFQMSAPISVDVISKNKIRGKLNVGAVNPVADMIVGDHIEAIAMLLEQEGSRLAYHDLYRNRTLVEGEGE